MRFDLELKVVSQLTENGLNNLSEMLYGDSNITPMFWDENSAVDKTQLNTGSVNYSNFNGGKYIDDSYYSSGVDTNSDDLKFLNNIVYGSTVIPVFNSGKYTINRSEFLWSKNNIVKPFSFDEKSGRYSCVVDPTIDPNKLIVSTLSFNYPGYIKNKKSFISVPWNQNYFEQTNSIEQTLQYIFKNNTADYKYSLNKNTVYLSTNKISYTNEVIGTVTDSINKIFVLPEFPVSNLSVSGCPASGYTLKSGIIIFNKTTNLTVGQNISVSYDVVPFISYIDSSRDATTDQVFFNTNMHPKLVNYKNGTLCLSNSFGDIDIPVELTINTDQPSIFGSESCRVTARLNTIGKVASPGEAVSLSILTDNAVFVDNNSTTITKTTFADGTVIADVIAATDKIGFYIQKEWVTGNKINIPYILTGANPTSTYLHFMTSDDPILGSKYGGGAELFVESYTNNTLESYTMNGRKVAYVSLQDDNGILNSKFIKPTNISFSIPGTIQIPIRHLGTSPASGSGITVIEYANVIPSSSNIEGYWLVSDSSIDIQATFNSDNITLESPVASVALQNIKSENSFILNKYNTSLGASQLGVFGYLTISEYLKNPYGLNACSIYCSHSDCIFKKCIHPDQSIQKNFILDDGKVGCIHNKEWDADPNNSVCPGQDANLVNPFIMHLEGI